MRGKSRTFFLEEKTFFLGQQPIVLRKSQVLPLISLITIIFLSNCFTTTGNPVPVRYYQDINYEGGPFMSRKNSAIYFKEEVINVTFDSSSANFNANYTLKNNGSSEEDIRILLPFIDHSSYSERPENVQLKTNGIKTWFKWMKIDLKFPTEYEVSKNFDAIYFDLIFLANEEKTIHVQYARKYLISQEYGCEYRYLVGTARSWNHSIESAHFEFRIPKKICTNFTRTFYSNNSYTETQETHDYYINTIHFSNWIPDERFNYISVRWERKFEPSYFGLLRLGGLLILLILISLFIFKKKVARNPK
jgi:hypothetical protein